MSMHPISGLALVADSSVGYLNYRPTAPLRFNAEPNLAQLIAREERRIDPDEVRTQPNDRIRTIFNGRQLEMVPSPANHTRCRTTLGTTSRSSQSCPTGALAVGDDFGGVPDFV